jgi:DNA-directed RNA polymerase specialized sigma24 family protein
MAYKKRMEWPPHLLEAVLEDVRLSHEAVREADTRFKIRVYLAVEQGLTTREVGDALGIPQATLSRYRREGEAAYRDRRAAE